jgi:transposase
MAATKIKKQQQEAKLTHEERKKRRKEIASYVASGKTGDQAAARFRVSLETVAKACKEHGVQLLRKGQGHRTAAKASGYSIVARIVEFPNMAEQQIAEEFGVSRQYINIVRTKAAKDGLFLAIEKAKQAAVDEAMREAKRAKG